MPDTLSDARWKEIVDRLVRLEAETEKHDYQFDNKGRLLFNPTIHERQGKPWSKDEITYLVANYHSIGSEEISLALGRTIATVHRRASQLREQGLLARLAKRIVHRRQIRPEKKPRAVRVPCSDIQAAAS